MGKAGAAGAGSPDPAAKWVRILVAVAGLTTAWRASGSFGGCAEGADAAEVFEQALAGAGAYAGDGVELGGAVADLAALAVVGDGEAVALVADLLDQVQDRGSGGRGRPGRPPGRGRR